MKPNDSLSVSAQVFLRLRVATELLGAGFEQHLYPGLPCYRT